jgi:hypothetical protein
MIGAAILVVGACRKPVANDLVPFRRRALGGTRNVGEYVNGVSAKDTARMRAGARRQCTI